jgi:small subunit ribosomal protein S8
MDPIADMLARIRNGASALRPVVEVPHSRIKESVARLLRQEGYLADVTTEGGPPRLLRLKLKYEGKKNVIEGLRRLSRPGLRRYVGAADIPRVRGGLGVVLISTSEGVMTGSQARKKNLGGELLCSVW